MIGARLVLAALPLLAGCSAGAVTGGGIPGIAYVSDAELWGVRDYWAHPQETLAVRAGDCEDHALLGAWFAQQRGVAPERMRIALGILPSGTWHAWLEIDGQPAVDTAPRTPRERLYAYPLRRGWERAADVRACILEGRCNAPAPAE